MTTTDRIIDEAENHVATTAHSWTVPEDGECLACYLVRALDVLGCDGGLALTRRWQRRQTASSRGLTAQLRSEGGWCDCEVVFTVLGRGLDDECGGDRR